MRGRVFMEIMTSKFQLSVDKWNTAIYIRLSQDDKEKSISNSVINQKKMLEEFVAKDNSLNIIDIYR